MKLYVYWDAWADELEVVFAESLEEATAQMDLPKDPLCNVMVREVKLGKVDNLYGGV